MSDAVSVTVVARVAETVSVARPVALVVARDGEIATDRFDGEIETAFPPSAAPFDPTSVTVTVTWVARGRHAAFGAPELVRRLERVEEAAGEKATTTVFVSVVASVVSTAVNRTDSTCASET